MEKTPIEIPMFREFLYPVIRYLNGRVWLTGILGAPFKEIRLVERGVVAAEFLQDVLLPAPGFKKAAG